LKWLIYLVIFASLVFLLLQLVFRPSHDRNWELGQEKLPYIAIDESNEITITNFRNFDWQKEGETTPDYETRTYSLDEIQTVDVLISHFDEFEGLAHIFLSFGFSDGEYVVVSLETRREVGEEFSPILGILRQFEIIYVVGSEEDIIGVRTDVRDDERVYLYPTKASPEKAKELFLALTSDINGVYAEPRMYNTLLNNCTNEITRRVEDISDINFPITWKTVMPGFFDEVLYEMELIQTDLPFEDIKERHLIDNNAVDRYYITYSSDLRNSIKP
jgi:hypothetical protein